MKLGDVPKCRREKSREDSSSALDEELKESTSAPVTPCKDVFSVTESSTSPEDAVKVKKSKGGRNARKSDGMGKKPSPGFTVKKRRTSKSAFKVGTRLSLRASPRKSVWEEKHSSFVAAAKVSFQVLILLLLYLVKMWNINGLRQLVTFVWFYLDEKCKGEEVVIWR